LRIELYVDPRCPAQWKGRAMLMRLHFPIAPSYLETPLVHRARAAKPPPPVQILGGASNIISKIV
jgi:hypothetical protein